MDSSQVIIYGAEPSQFLTVAGLLGMACIWLWLIGRQINRQDGQITDWQHVNLTVIVFLMCLLIAIGLTLFTSIGALQPRDVNRLY